MKPNYYRAKIAAVRIDPKPVEADLSQFEFTIGLLQCLPGTIARKYETIPVGLQGGTLWLAVRKGTPPTAMARLSAALRRPVRFFLVAPEPLRILLTRFYGVNE